MRGLPGLLLAAGLVLFLPVLALAKEDYSPPLIPLGISEIVVIAVLLMSIFGVVRFLRRG